MLQALEKELEDDSSDGSSPQAPSDEASPPAREPNPPSDSQNVEAAAESPAPTVRDEEPAPSPQPIDDDSSGQPVEQIPGSPKSLKSAQLVDLVSDEECGGEGVVEETVASSSTQPAKLKKHEYPEWYDPLKEDEQLPPEYWDMCSPSPQPAENKGGPGNFCLICFCFFFINGLYVKWLLTTCSISPTFICLEANFRWI